MDLDYTGDELVFQRALRDWLHRVVPNLGPAPAADDYVGRRAFDRRWQRALHDAGYAGIHWPKEFGGRGATPTEHLIYLEESARAGAPDEGVNFVGLLHAGPTLMVEGTAAQRASHLPAILRGDEVWCQGFSEPGAGSDLAAASTRAVRDGDEYVVTGQKIWTSYAPVADYCELLVRTDIDAAKHRGITWLIMPMDAPGIDVRPLRTIDGTTEFAELFLDEVRIPIANRVGEENDGWRVAMVTFAFERGTAFVGKLLAARRELELLVEVANELGRADDRATQREFARCAAELDGLWALTKRNVTRAGNGTIEPAAASAHKLAFADAAQHLAELSMRTLGPAGAAASDAAGDGVRALTDAALYSFAFSIAAGTSQIQRNIVAERGLGLPREPT